MCSIIFYAIKGLWDILPLFLLVLVIRNVCASTIVLLLDVSHVMISAIIISATILIKQMYI